MTKATAAPPQPQDPKEGGSYRRNDDGSLTRLQQTQPRSGRGAPAETPPPAPQPTNTANQE